MMPSGESCRPQISSIELVTLTDVEEEFKGIGNNKILHQVDVGIQLKHK